MARVRRWSACTAVILCASASLFGCKSDESSAVTPVMLSGHMQVFSVPVAERFQGNRVQVIFRRSHPDGSKTEERLFDLGAFEDRGAGEGILRVAFIEEVAGETARVGAVLNYESSRGVQGSAENLEGVVLTGGRYRPAGFSLSDPWQWSGSEVIVQRLFFESADTPVNEPQRIEAEIIVRFGDQGS